MLVDKFNVDESFNLKTKPLTVEGVKKNLETQVTIPESGTQMGTLTENKGISPVVNSVFAEFETIEGKDAHVGDVDPQNLTLPLGVVADSVSVTVDGQKKTVKKGKNTLTEQDLSSGKAVIDYTTAEKTIFGKKFKGSDYEDFSLMVSDMLKEGEKKIKAKFSDAPEPVVTGLLQSIWNYPAALNWNDTKTAVDELSKENPDYARAAIFAQNNASGGVKSFGLFKRRLMDLNKMAPTENPYRYIKRESKGKQTTFSVYDSQGNLIKAYTYPSSKVGNTKTSTIDLSTDSTATIPTPPKG